MFVAISATKIIFLSQSVTGKYFAHNSAFNKIYFNKSYLYLPYRWNWTQVFTDDVERKIDRKGKLESACSSISPHNWWPSVLIKISENPEINSVAPFQIALLIGVRLIIPPATMSDRLTATTRASARLKFNNLNPQKIFKNKNISRG